MTIRYNIIATHKCGSTILKKVLSCIFGDTKSKTLFDNHNVVTHEEAEYMFCRDTELIDDKIHANDKFVCVPRNPVSMSISMFYSYAYTHPQNKNQTKKQYKESRLKNQETGFDSIKAYEYGADEYGMHKYVMAFLKKGPNLFSKGMKL